jgi:hypothetical protein
MPLRRFLAITIVAAAIGGPTAALAASGGAPAVDRGVTASRAASRAEGASTAQPTSTAEPADAGAPVDGASPTEATAATSHPGSETPPARVEPAATPASIDTRLACKIVRDTDLPDRRAGIACAWTGVHHPKAAGYRLWRAVDVPDPEHHRTVIFRTRDLDHTRHLDTEIRPGHTFHYAVQVVGTDGGTLAWSNTVRVVVPPLPDRVEALRLGCEGVRADTDLPGVHRPGIACRWSPSTRPAFAFYRLIRGDGEERVVVFRTDDRRGTHHLDIEVEPGQSYRYVIEAVAADGHVVGRSEPARATAPQVRRP